MRHGRGQVEQEQGFQDQKARGVLVGHRWGVSRGQEGGRRVWSPPASQQTDQCEDEVTQSSLPPRLNPPLMPSVVGLGL